MKPVRRKAGRPAQGLEVWKEGAMLGTHKVEIKRFPDGVVDSTASGRWAWLVLICMFAVERDAECTNPAGVGIEATPVFVG